MLKSSQSKKEVAVMSQRFTKEKVLAALKKSAAVVTLFSLTLSFAGCAKKE